MKNQVLLVSNIAVLLIVYFYGKAVSRLVIIFQVLWCKSYFHNNIILFALFTMVTSALMVPKKGQGLGWQTSRDLGVWQTACGK